MSHSFRNAALPATGHWRSRERCCRQLKTSGLSSSVILHFQLRQNRTFPHLRVNASQTSVGAWQLRGSCLRFLQQISWHFQLTAVASTRVFRSHREIVRIGISPEDRRYVPGQIKKVVHMNFAVAGGGGNYQVTGWQAARGAWMVSPRSSCMSDSGGSTLLSLAWKPAALFVCTPALLFYVPFFFLILKIYIFFNGYKII